LFKVLATKEKKRKKEQEIEEEDLGRFLGHEHFSNEVLEGFLEIGHADKFHEDVHGFRGQRVTTENDVGIRFKEKKRKKKRKSFNKKKKKRKQIWIFYWSSKSRFLRGFEGAVSSYHNDGTLSREPSPHLLVPNNFYFNQSKKRKQKAITCVVLPNNSTSWSFGSRINCTHTSSIQSEKKKKKQKLI
jgi:hypothetical protein